jgi:hypothetical protein
MDADGSNDYCLTNSYQQEYEPIWSPDGTKIYFSRSVLGGCDPFEIFAYDLNTGLENRLTYNFNRELTPIVSPDGQFIVYAKGEEGHSGCSWMDVWIMRVDGSNQHLLYGASYSYDWPAAWGKANNRILIKTQSFNGMCQVALINPDGSDLVQLTETRYNAPAAFSPDEQKILFTSNNCPIGMNVFVMNIDGSNVVQLTEDPWENWANDWRALSRYTFEGFFSPIDNIPTVNKANAGQAIPVKWRITDKNGLPVSDPASFKSITSYSVSCSTFAGDPTSEVDEYAAGSSGLQYLGDGWWQFNWKTAKTYKGQCRIMKLTLDDHSVHTASFSFK